MYLDNLATNVSENAIADIRRRKTDTAADTNVDTNAVTDTDTNTDRDTKTYTCTYTNMDTKKYKISEVFWCRRHLSGATSGQWQPCNQCLQQSFVWQPARTKHLGRFYTKK